ncbi:MAG TPA: Trp biosynthesis-associated membrane protein [Jatrophihabitans sp.]|nr:Trp biosynthesis-associated membrane protein [Jatrophihabitans sp.]
MTRYTPFVLALLLDLIGAGGALLVATRDWQTVTTPRPAPLHDDMLQLSGRTVDAAPTALALVALAGVVAVLATRGVARRVVGGVLALAGAALVWRAVASAGAVSASRARTLVTEHHPTVDVSRAVPHVETHATWAALTLVCGALVAAAGALVAWRGHRWQVMSARYESASAQPVDPAQPAATLWTALDRGCDPTDPTD